jgi:glycosyltransferase involved in cell wall biosynthesis
MCKLSVIITAKDKNDQKLKELLYSIEQQTFKDYEVIIVTEGDSESAKAIGIKQAKGEIVCILASDNFLQYSYFFDRAIGFLNKYPELIGAFPMNYWYNEDDNILNRYFALFGVNDPIPLYLHKNDKQPYYNSLGDTSIDYSWEFNRVLTFGDNGMFVRRNILIQADIEHYYHIDVFQDLFNKGYKKYGMLNMAIWHRTGGNIFKFFIKRFKYADKFTTSYRRWHMIETRQDYLRLLWFIFCTITLIQPLYLSVKGYRVIKDKAWFLHPIVCWFTLITYGLWVIKRLVKK